VKKVCLIALLLVFPLVSEGQTLLHIPAEKLDHPVLFGSRIVEVNRSWGKVFAPGQRNLIPAQMEFRRDSAGNAVLFPPAISECREGGRDLAGRFRHIHPVHFPLVEVLPDGTWVIDVTEYFSRYPKQVSAIPPKMLEKEVLVEGSILSVQETPDYVQVTGRYRYASGLEVTAASYLLYLPEVPMPEKEPLEGYNKVEYPGPEGRRVGHSQRWDLSRRPTIDFYVDKAFPADWYPYIKEGLEDWNKAFEKAGLGKVIAVHPEPVDDPSFDRYSPLVNMVRYMDVEEANAKGDVLCDPRSGEILQADILWWKNVKDLITGWRYVQTGAADPAARAKEYSMEILGPMIRHSVSHEMGHALGLNHNMGASWSYPTRKLHSPSFTQEYGTSASVMDYARYNHLATAADVKAGVNLLPPRIGPYDSYVIACGYGQAKPEAREYCYYAPFYTAAISPDPSAQAETLGNNLLVSSKAGVRNCCALLELDGLDENRLRLISKQYYSYLWLALSNLGGSVNGKPVRWEEQKKTLIFVAGALDGAPLQLKDPVRENRILEELEGNFLPKRVEENMGPKGLEKYRKQVARLKKKYNF